MSFRNITRDDDDLEDASRTELYLFELFFCSLLDQELDVTWTRILTVERRCSFVKISPSILCESSLFTCLGCHQIFYEDMNINSRLVVRFFPGFLMFLTSYAKPIFSTFALL